MRRLSREDEERVRALLALPAPRAARALLGTVLTRRQGRRLLRARIVETEAYLGVRDPAAHAYRGLRTARTEPLWGPPGTVYVYFVYGMHHCLNLAVDREGIPGCVLIRAAEPLDDGLPAGALSGPGKLCRGLGIDTRLSGTHLFARGAPLTLAPGTPPRHVVVTPRVGISRAAARPLRFFDADSGAVSRGPARTRTR